MSLQYNILWVDDRKDEYQTLEIDKELEIYLNDLFFEPHIYMYENVEEAEKNLSQIKYDVIFSDYNIGENKNGKDFIIDIRKLNVKAEILFYSAQEKPPATEMDRISFLQLQSNTAYEELKDKMKSVIDLTVEKLNDLTNLRGLVMSEASELDDLMENIVKQFFLCDNATIRMKRQKLFLEKIVSNVENTIKDKLISCNNKTCKHIWNEKELEEIINSFDFDSSKKARIIYTIIRNINYTSEYHNFYESYRTEIMLHRNNLAHCKSMMKEGSEILITKNQSPFSYTREKIDEIRRNMRKYNHFLIKLLDEVSKPNDFSIR